MKRNFALHAENNRAGRSALIMGLVLLFCILGFAPALADELTLPAALTAIEDEAFMNDASITSVVIPDGTASIGARAFAGCTNLAEVTIPDSVTSIADGAFDGCEGLTVAAPAGSYAYEWGVRLGYIENAMPEEYFTYRVNNDSTVTITGYTGPTGQVDVVIPSRIEGLPVTEIGSNAFYNRKDLTGGLTIPRSVVSIGSEAFEFCSGFTGDLVIPEGVKSIGYYAFRDCRGFTGSLTIPKSMWVISDYAFSGCSGFTGNLTISEGVTYIGEHAFDSCKRFTGSLIIPDSVTSIDEYAFESCTGFTGSLTIPGSVKRISSHAFANCSGFTGSLTISDGVTNIENGAFANCSGFKGNLIIPESVTSIGDAAFANCAGFTGNLIIPGGVTSIGGAFSGCSGLTGSLKIPEGVTSIGSFDFMGCSGFTNIEIPDSVTGIEYGAFMNCSGLTDIKLPTGVTSIAGYAFNGCCSLEAIYIPQNVASIGDKAFDGCSDLFAIYGKIGSAAQTYAENNNIVFALWIEGVTQPEPGEGITNDYYRVLNMYSIGGEKYYRAQLMKEYNGVIPNTGSGYRSVYLNENLHAITDPALLAKLLTMYTYGSPSRWTELLSGWKSSGQIWHDTATEILQDELLIKNLGSTVGNVIVSVASGGSSMLSVLLDYSAAAVGDAMSNSAVLGTELAYINELTAYMNNEIDYALNVSILDEDGAYCYEKVIETLKLYEAVAIGHMTQKEVCVPIIDEIVKKYKNDWMLGLANVAKMFSEMLECASPCLSISMDLIVSMMEGDVDSMDTLTRFMSILENDLPVSDTFEYLLDAVKFFDAYAGVTAETAKEFFDYDKYIYTEAEIMETELYRHQLLFAQ